jgi:hypothetical protein
MEKSNKTQLGCWSLILIALIVMIFSGKNNVDELKTEVQDLKKEVVVLQQKMDSLSRALGVQQNRK